MQIQKGYAVMHRVDEAFQTIGRADFLPDAVKDEADIDAPLPIGYGQTNSQPSTVRQMLIWLDPHPGEKVLDVGAGSGWTSALLAYLVGPDCNVLTVEKVPELVKFGAENCRRAGIRNAGFFAAADAYGLPDFAPYDRILVSAAASRLPLELLDQLKPGGRIVIPVQNSIHVVDKTSGDGYKDTEHPGYVFVPLV